MDPAATGLAVVSVTIQLADGIKKLHDFWNSITEAPEDIKDNLFELNFLSGVLIQIAHNKQRDEPDPAFSEFLSGCCAKVNRLTSILEGIEPGFASTSSYIRRWTAVKAVLKHEKLKKFQESLERLKNTLSLVLQLQNSRTSQEQHIFVKQRLVTLTQRFPMLSIQENQREDSNLQTTVAKISSGHRTSCGDDCNTTELGVALSTPGQSDLLFDQSAFPDSSSGIRQRKWRSKRVLANVESTTHLMLGTVRVQSKTKLQISSDQDDLTRCGRLDQCEHESTYTIYPAAWLVWLGIRRGFRLGFQSSPIQGWKTTLKTYRPVPDDALIFNFCKDGNLPAVRTLLLGGQASVRDTDSWGCTPLHYAAEHFHPELCKFLNNSGADMNALTHNAKSPVELAAEGNVRQSTYAMLPDISDTFRLLIGSMDFMGQDGNGWSVLYGLCDASCETSGERAAKIALLVWMLRLVSSEMKMCGVERHYANMLNWTLCANTGLSEASRLFLRLGGPKLIDEPVYYDGGYTILHLEAAHAEGQERLDLVLAQGPDVHRLGLDFDMSPAEESPFSLILYSSWGFRDWLDALVIAGKDIEEFVTEEIKRNHNIHPGWEKETLLDLLTYDHVDDYFPRIFSQCGDCTKEIDVIRVQPHWRHFLERIKHGIDPYYSPVEVSSEVDEEESAESRSMMEAVDNTDDPSDDLDNVDSEMEAESDSGSELEIESESESESGSESESIRRRWEARWKPEWELWDSNPHDYPTTISLQSECVYCPHEIVCMNCWLSYIETGTRRNAD